MPRQHYRRRTNPRRSPRHDDGFAPHAFRSYAHVVAFEARYTPVLGGYDFRFEACTTDGKITFSI